MSENIPLVLFLPSNDNISCVSSSYVIQ